MVVCRNKQINIFIAFFTWCLKQNLALTCGFRCLAKRKLRKVYINFYSSVNFSKKPEVKKRGNINFFLEVRRNVGFSGCGKVEGKINQEVEIYSFSFAVNSQVPDFIILRNY